MMRIFIVICCFLFFGVLMPSVLAQQNLEHLLDNVDNQSSWAHTPVSGASPRTPLSRPIDHRLPLNSYENNKTDWSSSSAYTDWQEAENQASRAHNAEERARYEKDKWRCGDDASAAYYAANASRNASDKVYYASQNGDPTAREYASRARAAADRARADSDQARYYADSNN